MGASSSTAKVNVSNGDTEAPVANPKTATSGSTSNTQINASSLVAPLPNPLAETKRPNHRTKPQARPNSPQAKEKRPTNALDNCVPSLEASGLGQASPRCNVRGSLRPGPEQPLLRASDSPLRRPVELFIEMGESKRNSLENLEPIDRQLGKPLLARSPGRQCSSAPASKENSMLPRSPSCSINEASLSHNYGRCNLDLTQVDTKSVSPRRTVAKATPERSLCRDPHIPVTPPPAPAAPRLVPQQKRLIGPPTSVPLKASTSSRDTSSSSTSGTVWEAFSSLLCGGGDEIATQNRSEGCDFGGDIQSDKKTKKASAREATLASAAAQSSPVPIGSDAVSTTSPRRKRDSPGSSSLPPPHPAPSASWLDRVVDFLLGPPEEEQGSSQADDLHRDRSTTLNKPVHRPPPYRLLDVSMLKGVLRKGGKKRCCRLLFVETAGKPRELGPGRYDDPHHRLKPTRPKRRKPRRKRSSENDGPNRKKNGENCPPSQNPQQQPQHPPRCSQRPPPPTEGDIEPPNPRKWDKLRALRLQHLLTYNDENSTYIINLRKKNEEHSAESPSAPHSVEGDDSPFEPPLSSRIGGEDEEDEDDALIMEED